MKRNFLIFTITILLSLTIATAITVINKEFIPEPIEEVINNSILINGHARILNHKNTLTVIEGLPQIPDYAKGAIQALTSDKYALYAYSELDTGIFSKGKLFGISAIGDFGTGVYGMGQNFGLYGYSPDTAVYGFGGRDQGYGGKFYGYTGVYAATTGSYGFETPNSLFIGQDATIRGKIKGQVISIFLINNTGNNFCRKFNNVPSRWSWQCISCINLTGQIASCYSQQENLNCICKSV